jgi:serine/threonine-protein kinase
MTERLAIGTVLGDRFEIQDFLGAGSFGEVYLARQVIFGHPFRDVALKLFKGDAVTAENVKEVFSDAVAIIRMMDSQSPAIARHIVQILDLGLIDQPTPRAYMSMQLVPGRQTLDQRIRRYRSHGMPVDLTLHYLDSMLPALAWIHEQNMIHGDLKPDNLLLDKNDEIVITDFGLAAHVRLGACGGAVSYEAPEVLSGLGGHAQSDIYSVGIIWYQMLTGRHPFDEVGLGALGDNDMQAYREAQLRSRKWMIRRGASSEHIQAPSDFNDELEEQPQIEELLKRCLTWSTSERFANAGMLKRALDDYRRRGHTSMASEAQVSSSDPVPALATTERVVADALTIHANGESEQALERLSGECGLGAILAKARILSELAASLRGQESDAHYKEANRLLSVALKENPKSADVFCALKHFYTQQGKTDLANRMRLEENRLR